jgi:hypothetical protein
MNPSKRALSSLAVCGAFSLAPLTVLGLAWNAQPQKGGQVVEIEEEQVFIEYNATDEDIGVHFFWDAEDWDRMQITSPEGESVLKVRATKGLAEQGLTEGFFESAEPSLTEISLEEFFERFPAGEYTFKGVTIEGDTLVGESEFTHTMPAAPQNLFPPEGATVSASQPLVLSFDAVTQDLEGNPLTPDSYEVIVEHEGDVLRVFSVILDGDVPNPSVTVPPEFLQSNLEYKLEVLVREESGNKTISETSFTTS